MCMLKEISLRVLDHDVNYDSYSVSRHCPESIMVRLKAVMEDYNHCWPEKAKWLVLECGKSPDFCEPLTCIFWVSSPSLSAPNHTFPLATFLPAAISIVLWTLSLAERPVRVSGAWPNFPLISASHLVVIDTSFLYRKHTQCIEAKPLTV